MKQEKLKEIFGRFAGAEVPMVEEHKKLAGATLVICTPVNNPDPVLQEMKQVAKENGLTLRLHWPGLFSILNYHRNRVNAHVEKAADGKWRVADKFTIG